MGIVATAPPASAYPSADVSLIGHGYGHGRGMGQWGAFGYALAGLSWQQIVEHYYSTAVPAPTTPQQEGAAIRVALTENNGNDVIVTSQSGYSVAGTAVAPGQAVLMHPEGTTWLLELAPGCAGPWGPLADGVVNPVAVPNQNSNLGDADSAAVAMQLCQGGGNLSVRGSLEATYNSDGAARTVNVLPLEEYVAGVVPNESPAYWGTLGPPGLQGRAAGYQELEAQAVAARSYVMAAPGSYGGYADTCDLSCQTYRGLANENPLTDAATLDTLGYVMESAPGGVPNGVPLSTQYSASTGGYTAPGNFPAVPDDGDAVCPPGVNGACNPNHTWKANVPVSTVEANWPQLGSLESVSVTARNGYGDWGGRVTSMTLVGSAQSVVVTGDQFAAACNLLSDWFTVANSLSAPAVGIAPTPGRGRLLARRLGRFRGGVRRRNPLRLARRPAAGRPGGRDGGHAGRERLLGGGGGRRHLRLRRRPVLRIDRCHPPQPTDRRDGLHPGRERLLAGGLRRRRLRVRGCPLRRVDRRHAPQPAGRGDGAHPGRWGLLAGGLGRRDLRLR